MEFLENDPVADHVLDRIGHHRQRRADEIGAVAGVAERGEGLRRSGGGPAPPLGGGATRALNGATNPPPPPRRTEKDPPPPHETAGRATPHRKANPAPR